MKAVILAAGKGTRLGEITTRTPKPLLEVDGKPILQHQIELCAKHGVRELFINTHHLAEKIRDRFGDGSSLGVSITYSYEPDLLGTAGALHNFQEHLYDSHFFALYGDNRCDYDLRSLYDFHIQKSAIGTIALFEKQDVANSGIAILDPSNRILRFIEKPEPSEYVSNLVNAGVYVLSPRIFEYIPHGYSDFGRDIFPKLISEGEMLFGVVTQGRLDAVDTIELYHEARDKEKK